MNIIVKNALVKTHYFIGMIKRYYKLLQYIYSIITIKILSIEPNLIPKIFFITINKLVNFDSLVSILLIFSIYLKMII